MMVFCVALVCFAPVDARPWVMRGCHFGGGAFSEALVRLQL